MAQRELYSLEGTLAGEWMQEGIVKGLQQGWQEGLQQGLQQGIRLGLLQSISLGLELKFGAAGLRLLPRIGKIEDVGTLQAIHDTIRTASELRDIRRLLP